MSNVQVYIIKNKKIKKKLKKKKLEPDMEASEMLRSYSRLEGRNVDLKAGMGL